MIWSPNKLKSRISNLKNLDDNQILTSNWTEKAIPSSSFFITLPPLNDKSFLYKASSL